MPSAAALAQLFLPCRTRATKPHQINQIHQLLHPLKCTVCLSFILSASYMLIHVNFFQCRFISHALRLDLIFFSLPTINKTERATTTTKYKETETNKKTHIKVIDMKIGQNVIFGNSCKMWSAYLSIYLCKHIPMNQLFVIKKRN